MQTQMWVGLLGERLKLMITSSQITVLRHLTIKTTAYMLELCYTEVPSILLSSILDSLLSVP